MAKKLRGMENISQISNMAEKKDKQQKFLSLSSLIDYRDSDGTGNDYLFGPITEENIKNLADGIKREGFQGAINVWNMKDGTYMIFSGHRRAAAMRLLNKEMIPCFIYDYPEAEVDRRRMFLGANIYTRGSAKTSDNGGDLYVGRQMEYLGEIMKKYEGFEGSEFQMDKKIAAEFGTSRPMVYRYRSLLHASDELIRYESEGLIPLAQASIISMMSQEDQNIVLGIVQHYNDIKRPLTNANITLVINKLKEFNKAEKEIDEDTLSFAEKSSQITSFINSVIESKFTNQENKQTESEKKKKRSTSYEICIERADSFIRNIRSCKYSDMTEQEIDSLRGKYSEAFTALKTYTELMHESYKGKQIISYEDVSDDMLREMSLQQLKQIGKHYKDAGKTEVAKRIMDFIKEKDND